MSASREKKRRQEQYQAGAPKGKNQPAEKKTPGWKIALYWVLGIVFVIAFAAVLLLNSNFFARHTTAVTVGSHKLSPAMTDIYYSSSYANFYETYGDYISMFFDTDTPLKDQVYDESTGKSWSDYFMDDAKQSMVWAYTLYDKAVEEGYKLTDDEKSTIDAYVDSFKAAAESYGFSSVNGYLAAYYGNGVNEKIYRDFLKVQLLATDYYSDKVAGFSFTDADKSAFYAEHAENYDTITLEYSYISGNVESKTETDEDGNEVTVDPTDEELDAAMEAAKAKAEEILAGGHDAMEEYDLRPVNDYTKSTLSYLIPSEASDWAFDSARQEGDMELFESASAYYVVRYLSRNNNDYLTKNIRLIQITPATAETVNDADGNKDTEATEAAQEANNSVAKAKAKSVFEEWQDGDATEDSFIALVEQYSDGELADGGLYENITNGEITTEVSEWLYDEGRRAGDCQYFTGYDTCYIVYLLGDGLNCQSVLVEDDIVSDAYTTWYDEASAAYPVADNDFGMKFVSLR